MSLPVSAVILPAVLAGRENGKLEDAVLSPVDGGRLLTPAARAWNAMVAAAGADGIDLAAGDTYRDLGTQMSYFMERYTLEELGGRPSKVWLGQRYWQRPNTDEAAVPGNSNHGWGLAVDVRKVTYANRLIWLIYNAARFGFSAEIQNEAWHWRYFGGDNFQLPNGTPHDELTPQLEEEDDDMAKGEWRILQPAGSAALFIAPMLAFPDGTLGALYATWLSGAEAAMYEARGVERLGIAVEDLRNVNLHGGIPTGDVREWSAADFHAVIA